MAAVVDVVKKGPAAAAALNWQELVALAALVSTGVAVAAVAVVVATRAAAEGTILSNPLTTSA